jgi:putative FmdB family regulatory protein
MPIYEYRCSKCGEVSEQLMLGKGDTPSCRECGSEDLVKLMSAHNTMAPTPSFSAPAGGSCCGSPDSCGSPGGCCAN